VEYYGENAKSSSPTIFFTVLANFVRNFKQADAENIERKKMEQRVIETERRKVDAAKARRPVGHAVNGADIQAVTDELNAVLTNGAFKHQYTHMIVVQAPAARRRRGRHPATVSRQSYAIVVNCTMARSKTSSTACAKSRIWRLTVWRRANNARSERPHRRPRKGAVWTSVHLYVCRERTPVDPQQRPQHAPPAAPKPKASRQVTDF
jgi:hypothetical protein